MRCNTTCKIIQSSTKEYLSLSTPINNSTFVHAAKQQNAQMSSTQLNKCRLTLIYSGGNIATQRHAIYRQYTADDVIWTIIYAERALADTDSHNEISLLWWLLLAPFCQLHFRRYIKQRWSQLPSHSCCNCSTGSKIALNKLQPIKPATILGILRSQLHNILRYHHWGYIHIDMSTSPSPTYGSRTSGTRTSTTTNRSP